MKAELQKQLFDKYPGLFAQKDKPMTETAMCWGIDTGDGWFSLINALCAHLAWDIEHNDMPSIEFTQVKEKYGTLRIYYRGGNQKSDGMIDIAETISGITCENCGNYGTIRDSGWIRTLCEECFNKKE